MLSARDHVKKSWNNQFNRRVSLPEIIPFLNYGKSCEKKSADLGCDGWSVKSRRKTSEHSLSSIFTDWNDFSDTVESCSTDCGSTMSDECIKEFFYTPSDFVWFLPYVGYVFPNDTIDTPFDSLLKSSWTSAAENGALRYQVDKLKSKILPGKIGFVAQLNPKRAVERRAPSNFESINEPFDGTKFNFRSIKAEEFLFSMQCETGISDFSRENDEKSGLDYVIVNVSPLEYCNVLLVPKLYSCLPQVLTGDALRLAMHSILLSGTWTYRVGFNSLGAMASVNHLHFHAYYLKYNLPTESLSVSNLCGPCFVVSGYPANGLCFQFPPLDFRSEHMLEHLEKFISDVNGFIHCLHQAEVPHNIFLTRGTPLYPSMSRENLVIRLYVWTQDFFHGAKSEAAFNVALCELSGHLPIKTEEHFSNLTESEVSDLLDLKTQSMSQKAQQIAKNFFISEK